MARRVAASKPANLSPALSANRRFSHIVCWSMRVPPVALLVCLSGIVGCTSRGSHPTPVPQIPQIPHSGLAVYETDVALDPANASLTARSTFRYLATKATAKRVSLLLNRGLSVPSLQGPRVRSFRLAASELSPLWNRIDVELDGTAAPGSMVTLHMTYAGRPEFSSDAVNGISESWVELNVDSQWHPIAATFDQEIVGNVRITLPAGWQVLGSGQVETTGLKHVIRNRIPQLDVAFVAAPFFDKASAGQFTVYFRKAPRATAAAVLEAAGNCSAYLNARYGAGAPLPDGSLVLADRQGPGYARKNYIVLSQVNPADKEGLHQFLCHELTHYWTRSAGAFSPDHWMSEAFAEYVAGRYIRDHVGRAAFDRRRSQWEAAGGAHGPVWTPESTARSSFFVMYRKAPYLLSALEDRIGAERMDRFVERYLTEGVQTTVQLLKHLEAVAGKDAADWFRVRLAEKPQ